jgi:hypothetical protein
LEKEYEIKLKIDELMILDGKVSEKAQCVINVAKKESSYGFNMPVMNEVIKKAEEIGKLTWTYKQIKSCNYCSDKKYDYHRYPRSGKYHNKGDKNYNKPKYYSGIKFNEGFVTIQGSGDMCRECCESNKVIQQLIDYVLDNDLKVEIQKNDYKDGKYLKDPIQICYSCEYEMTESEMGRNSTMIGDGTYPSTCPKCDAKASAFGNSHKTTNKFKHTLNPVSKNEVQQIKKLVKLHNDQNEKDNHISLSSNRNRNTMFYVREDKFNNGNRLVIKFDTEEEVYHAGYFYRKQCEEFVAALNGYERTEDEYFDFKFR